jgi:hypothetical protein
VSGVAGVWTIIERGVPPARLKPVTENIYIVARI